MHPNLVSDFDDVETWLGELSVSFRSIIRVFPRICHMLYALSKKPNMCLVYLYNLFWSFFARSIDLFYSEFPVSYCSWRN